MLGSGSKVVKSASRCLAILEFFDEIVRPASAAEIREALGLPASSASALLGSLVTLGYLHYDPRRRDYRQTPRAGLLGEGARIRGFSGQVRAMLESLTQQTGQLVVLGARCQLNAQYIQVIRAAGSRPVKRGALAPLTRPAVGWMLMSELDDASILRIAMRFNAAEPERKVSPTWLLAQIAEVRESGFAYCFGHVTEGVGAISVRMPAASDEALIVLAVSGSGQRFVEQKHDIVAAMRSHVAGLVRDRGAAAWPS
jgi:DNA-binding IclR family transcriptional regulator